MLDGLLRPIVDPLLNAAAETLARLGISANMLTFSGFIVGMLSCFLLTVKAYDVAAILLIISRAFDLMDGAVARIKKTTSDWGGYLDIVLDFIVYAAFPFCFALGQPSGSLAAGFLLFSYMGTAATFLAFAITAAKRGMTTDQTGEKSFFHQAGLIGATETVLFMLVCCFYPEGFSAFAAVFGILCWITATQRFFQAQKLLG
jgi:phosphatidylglycerophosphate synthase